MSDEQMLQVYRHDAHKVRGRSHDSAVGRLAGVRVNLDVPYGADGDASAMSRPSGEPSRVVDNHDTHYRLSLFSGSTRYDPNTFNLEQYRDELHDLLAIEDAASMHRAWLTSRLMTAFNEAVHYPYTSLKYHTLLVAALVDIYRNGHTFDDLWLAVDGDARIVNHRTVYADDAFALRLTPEPEDRPRATLGSRPWRSWASAWGRLTEHPPLDVGSDKFDMMLDANLRRVQAWSTALQYIEDFRDWRSA